MKNRTDQILLALFVLSLVLYGVILVTFIEYGGRVSPAPLGVLLFRQLHVWLALGFHAVPFFCLQLLLCRTARRRVAALPALLLSAFLLACAAGYLRATGWDALGWVILLLGCAAPAVGCVLAWAVYGFHRLYQRGGIHG